MRRLIVLLFLLSAANAQIESYDMVLDLSDSNVHQRIDIKFSQASEFRYTLPFEPKNLRISPGGILENDGGKYVIITDKTDNLLIEFDTGELISPFEGKYLFRLGYAPAMQAKKTSITLKLPRGMGLESGSMPSISPPPNDIDSDGGRIIIRWDYENLADEVRIFALYAPVENSDRFLYGIIMGAIVATFFFIVLRRRDSRIKLVMMTLTEDERKIVDAVRENPRQQRELCQITDFSKSKVSKLIQNLEVKNVVRKIRAGRTNKIALTEFVKDRKFVPDVRSHFTSREEVDF